MPFLLLRLLLPVGMVLSLLMLVDCALNKRPLTWFFILILLGPLGGLVYLIYHWQYVTFPAAFGGGGRGYRRCPRCRRSAERLFEYRDGRSLLHLCGMCKSEIEPSCPWAEKLPRSEVERGRITLDDHQTGPHPGHRLPGFRGSASRAEPGTEPHSLSRRSPGHR